MLSSHAYWGTGTAQEAHLSVQGWALCQGGLGGQCLVLTPTAGYRYSIGSPLICSGVGIMSGGG